MANSPSHAALISMGDNLRKKKSETLRVFPQHEKKQSSSIFKMSNSFQLNVLGECVT